MKIQYCSDLHLEFKENKKFLDKHPIKPVGEILLLAGDVVPLSLLNQYSGFFDSVSDDFETVYWIPGNHEYYYYDISGVKNPLYEKIRDNVFLINNNTIRYKNVNVIFSTLWSYISPQNEWDIQQNVSDFSLIKSEGKKFLPAQFNELHKTAFAFLEKTLSLTDAGTNVVITHHVPTLLNYPEQYKNSNLNEAFVIELHDFIYNSNAAYWIYGHHHYNTPEFKIGNTSMLTNQLGYVHYNEHANFRTNATIEI